MDLLKIYTRKELRFHVEPSRQQTDVLGTDSGIIRFTRRQLGATTAVALKALDESFNKDNSVNIVVDNYNQINYIKGIILACLDYNEIKYKHARDYVQIIGKKPMRITSMNKSPKVTPMRNHILATILSR